jgi:hypothetical protein
MGNLQNTKILSISLKIQSSCCYYLLSTDESNLRVVINLALKIKRRTYYMKPRFLTLGSYLLLSGRSLKDYRFRLMFKNRHRYLMVAVVLLFLT